MARLTEEELTKLGPSAQYYCVDKYWFKLTFSEAISLLDTLDVPYFLYVSASAASRTELGLTGIAVPIKYTHVLHSFERYSHNYVVHIMQGLTLDGLAGFLCRPYHGEINCKILGTP